MLDIQDIPYDAGIDKDNAKIYDGDDYLSYGYFGNCITTVPSVWNATQMSGFIRKCYIIPVSKVCNKIYDGDRKLPKKLIKGILKLLEIGELDNLEYICAGIDFKERIMWIYLTSEDIHYFFDCNNFRVEPEEDFEDMYESRKASNDKRQLYESIMKSVAKEVKKALFEAEKEKELNIIDYILGESLEENTNKSTILLRFKLVAKKGLLTTAIIFAVLPKMSASEQTDAIKYMSNNNIAIEMTQELSKQNYETIEVVGESTNEQLARKIALSKAQQLSAKGYQITTDLKTLHNSETNCYKYVITLVKVTTNRNTPPAPVQTPPLPMPAN